MRFSFHRASNSSSSRSWLSEFGSRTLAERDSHIEWPEPTVDSRMCTRLRSSASSFRYASSPNSEAFVSLVERYDKAASKKLHGSTKFRYSKAGSGVFPHALLVTIPQNRPRASKRAPPLFPGRTCRCQCIKHRRCYHFEFIQHFS